jgi:DNA-binding transcriptional ArsR family regulator
MNKQKLMHSYNMVLFLSRKSVKRIIAFIPKEGANVTQILIKLRDMPQCFISKYLSQLRSYDLVYCVREGKYQRYFINYAKFDKINKAIKKIN